MISVEDNIKACEENINKLITQRNDITNELLRLDGALRVFVDMKKAGVTNIETQDPLKSTEVIDEEVQQ